MWDWLLAPLDAARAHDVHGAIAWHARTMALAWGLLVPCGILAARFLKLWPGQQWPAQLDHPGWWHLHRACQYAAGMLTVAGIVLIVMADKMAFARSAHGLLGWSVIVLGLVQFIGAWLRGSKGGPSAPAPDGSWRGDHYDMTTRRIVFEYVHKYGGYTAAVLAIGAIISGLWQANAPRWMALSLGAWWAACVIVAIVMQRRGRAFDTYQAHWGPDMLHPGNQRAPIGLGVRRCQPNRTGH